MSRSPAAAADLEALLQSRSARGTALCAAILLPAGAASAGAPDRFDVVDEYDFLVDCGDFTAQVQGQSSTRYIVFYDKNGDLLSFTKYVDAPTDVWTSTTTGASIIVRGHFSQSHDLIAGSEDFAVTVRGFRYMVNVPGSGVTVREVGRITYDDPAEEVALTQAGQHDLASASLVEPGLCAELAAAPAP